MPQLRHGRGRSFKVAVIRWDNDRTLALLDEFGKATRDLTYGERMALSRACMVTETTVRHWQYRVCSPRWDTMLAVIDWVKAGKQTETKYQPHPRNFSML